MLYLCVIDCLISYCPLLLMCTQFASTLDLLPTVFNLVGATIPNDRVMDGYDMAPILFKRGQVCGFTQSYIPICKKYTQHSSHRFYTCIRILVRILFVPY